ncbi:Lrp/AsnC family transcriptional regulator [Streptomyces kronopolitis]|uniref:Lrp/AsnC family transcriptional regulator n=2 Tax=Streptomyces kronopolitis TaxID=1612435 RepID=UPI0036957249
MHDALDEKIIYALDLDGRAPLARIAEVLGVSGQTVVRRYTRLRADGVLRVLGLTYPSAGGEEEWFIRIQCTPDAASTVAEALARHAETSWVYLTSGGTEIVCVTRTDPDAEPLLLRKLPRTPRVTAINAHCLLHTFCGGGVSTPDKPGPLTPDQADRLRLDPLPTPATARTTSLSRSDHKLLAALHQDGRATYRDLAAATGWAQSTAQRRTAELRSAGVLYFDVDYHPASIGRRTQAMLWLSVAPAALIEAGQALARHQEVSFAVSTTGPTNLFAIVNCENSHALHRYLTGPIAALPAVTHVETAPVIRTLKRAGVQTPP